MRYAAFFLLLFAALFALSGHASDDISLSSAQEKQAHLLFKSLRCIVCQGQSLEESNARIAQDLRHVIREKLAQGTTEEEVRQFLITRYGESILLEPPFVPSTWLLWVSPFLCITVGILFCALSYKHKQRKS